MYTIHLMSGVSLSSYDLNKPEVLERLNDRDLDILKYLQNDIIKVDIKKLKEDYFDKKNSK